MSDGSWEPEDEADDDDSGAVVGGALVEAGGDATPVLEPVHAPLDHVALPVAERVEAGWSAGPAALIDPGRDGVGDATPAQQPPAGAVAVARSASRCSGRLRGRPCPLGRGTAMPSINTASWVLS
jgi:hypothetical protein